ncbi:MAG: hypothetical protein WBB08_08160 [Halobacteriota archaeon]
MLLNATNSTNMISSVKILSGIWNFLSDYWQVLTALAAIITIFVLVIGMFFKRYLQKKQHEHEKEMERLRQEHDKQAAKEQIIKQLKRFISAEKNDISKIADWHQEKIAEVGNDLKKTLMDIDKNRILFSQIILEELFVFRDKVRDLSGIQLHPSEARELNPDFWHNQIQNREKKGNELIEEARGFIKKLEK